MVVWHCCCGATPETCGLRMGQLRLNVLRPQRLIRHREHQDIWNCWKSVRTHMRMAGYPLIRNSLAKPAETRQHQQERHTPTVFPGEAPSWVT